MASNKAFKFGPVALTTTLTTNIFNCNVTSLAGPVGFTLTQPYVIMTKIRVVNKTASAATVSLWVGASGVNAAGTEFGWLGASVPANGSVEINGRYLFNAADFLVGGSGTATALSIQGEGEIGFSG